MTKKPKDACFEQSIHNNVAFHSEPAGKKCRDGGTIVGEGHNSHIRVDGSDRDATSVVEESEDRQDSTDRYCHCRLAGKLF